MALQPWRMGIVSRIEELTHNTRRYFISVPDTTQFDFTPGQFVTLDLPISEKANKRLRSYSIASWPAGNNEFELLIVLAPHGIGTHHIFHEWKEGTEIKFRGPQGIFVLPPSLDKNIYLICTGTGIAPFRSMINYVALHNIPFRNIHLVFGCRKKCDLLYFDELTDLQKRLPGFHYHPTLSREEWEGRRGYVHPIYEELASGDPDAVFYLCGWKQMIDEAKKRIMEKGYDKKQINLELYG
jgi:NAD(P)H-flavin reductase